MVFTSKRRRSLPKPGSDRFGQVTPGCADIADSSFQDASRGMIFESRPPRWKRTPTPAPPPNGGGDRFFWKWCSLRSRHFQKKYIWKGRMNAGGCFLASRLGNRCPFPSRTFPLTGTFGGRVLRDAAAASPIHVGDIADHGWKPCRLRALRGAMSATSSTTRVVDIVDSGSKPHRLKPQGGMEPPARRCRVS